MHKPTPPTLAALAALALAVLACTLTSAPSAATLSDPPPRMTPRAELVDMQSAPSATPAKVCTVQTGYTSGRLHLRTCAGTSCPVLAVLAEGAQITPQPTAEAVEGWLNVATESGTGWVYSRFVTCEVKP